jgi:RNase P protein component
VVLIPRHTASTASYTELEKDFLRLLKRRHFTT